MRICTGDIIPSRGLSKNKSWHYGNKVRYLSKAIAQTGRSISAVHMHGVHVGRVRFPPAREISFFLFLWYKTCRRFCAQTQGVWYVDRHDFANHWCDPVSCTGCRAMADAPRLSMGTSANFWRLNFIKRESSDSRFSISTKAMRIARTPGGVFC